MYFSMAFGAEIIIVKNYNLDNLLIAHISRGEQSPPFPGEWGQFFGTIVYLITVNCCDVIMEFKTCQL